MMPKEYSLAWWDGLLKKSGIPYPIICSIIGITIYLIYLFFGRMLDVEWEQTAKFIFIVMGVSIAYQLSGAQYLLDEFKKILKYISLLSDIDEDNLYTRVRSKFAGSLWFYALLAIVVLPFYLTDLIASPEYTSIENYTLIGYLMEQFLPDYTEGSSYWFLAFDIYQQFIGFLSLILLAYILWIVLNITQTLRSVSLNFHSTSSNTNVFSVYMKLRPLKNSILSILFYYLICVSLLVLSYGLSDYLLERIALIALLIVGLIFCFIGYESLNDIVRSQIDYEMDQINRKTKEYAKKLLAIDPNGDYNPKIQETNFISNMLDVLQKQRDSLMKANTRVYDLRSIIGIISAFMIPILTNFITKKINLLLESGDIGNILLNPIDIVNQGIASLNSTIHLIK
jgi:hypothetical protein